jgi:outer membrane protein assembly factor BamB
MGTKPMKHTSTLFLFLAWLLLAGCGGSSSPGNTAVTRPPVAFQLVYVVSTAGLSADQASNGKQCWSVQPSSPSLLSAQQPIALVGGVLYWVADQLYALDASDGTTRWSAPVGDTPGAVSTRGNLVYVLSADLLYAFSTGDGTLRWRQQLPYNLGRTATLLLDNGTLYAVNGANLTALRPDSGAIHWQFSLDPDLGESIKEIFLAGKTLLVWSSTTLDGLDAGTGHVLWHKVI